MHANAVKHALAVIARTLREGEATHRKDTPEHWRSLSARAHAIRAAEHLVQWLKDESDDMHLAHALTRLVLAAEQDARERIAARWQNGNGDNHHEQDSNHKESLTNGTE